MAAEEVMKLFDFYWFEHDMFAAKQMVSMSNPILDEIRNHDVIDAAKLSNDPGMLKGRSFSDRYLRYDSSSTISDYSSPRSVIVTPRLQKILSGQEICEFSKEEEVVVKKSKKKVMNTKRRGKGMSRSLSELEFEEVKGFMELGFVFTEEDKSTSLVSIIPGLQRLGREKDDEQSTGKISRPYLSEAWDVLDNKKATRQLMKMKFSSLPNENDIKHHLKTWAHTVASTVR